MNKLDILGELMQFRKGKMVDKQTELDFVFSVVQNKINEIVDSIDDSKALQEVVELRKANKYLKADITRIKTKLNNLSKKQS